MIAYNIYLPPAGQSHRDAAAIKFLPDNTSWVAAFIPPLWLIWHQLWWALGVYIGYSVAIILMAMTSWIGAAMLLSALPGLYLFLEGHELVRQKHEALGWSGVGVVHANNVEDAELRYFTSDLAQNTELQGTTPEPVLGQMAKLPASGMPKQSLPTGLFPLDDTS